MGTDSITEIGLALKHEIPVILLSSWQLERPDGRDEPFLRQAANARQAVDLALGLVNEKGPI